MTSEGRPLRAAGRHLLGDHGTECPHEPRIGPQGRAIAYEVLGRPADARGDDIGAVPQPPEMPIGGGRGREGHSIAVADLPPAGRPVAQGFYEIIDRLSQVAACVTAISQGGLASQIKLGHVGSRARATAVRHQQLSSLGHSRG